MYTKLTPCDMQPDTDSMTGTLRHGNCYWNVRPRRDESRGCGVTAAEGTFGDDFNARGGGVWALLLDKRGIKIWHFDRSDVPADIEKGNPNPEHWGVKPVMNFAPRNCDVKKAWQKMNIVSTIVIVVDELRIANSVSDHQHYFLRRLCGKFVLGRVHWLQAADEA